MMRYLISFAQKTIELIILNAFCHQYLIKYTTVNNISNIYCEGFILTYISKSNPIVVCLPRAGAVIDLEISV